MKERLFLGVDLGGTQLRMAAVGADGALASSMLSVPTGRSFTPQDLARKMADLIEQMRSLVEGAEIEALGLGTAGVILDHAITQADNLPLLNGCDLQALIAPVAGMRVEVENDANCFALAEARFGAGRGARHLVGVTLGTGVGSGVIIDSRVHRGAHGAAGEVYRIPCRGEQLEYHLSGAGVVRNFRAAGATAEELAGDIDAARVAALARSGNAAARRAWEQFAEDLHLLCECFIALIDPEAIIIGGSLAQARDLFEAKLMRRLGERPVRIAYAELGAAAGVIGAAALNI